MLCLSIILANCRASYTCCALHTASLTHDNAKFSLLGHVYTVGGHIERCCDPSDCLSVCLSHVSSSTTVHFRDMVTTVLKSHAGQRAVRPLKVAETATRPSPGPLQDHSLGGCTIVVPPSKFRRPREHIVSRRDTVFTYGRYIRPSQFFVTRKWKFTASSKHDTK